jgi:CBS domain-containing protein
MFVKNILVGKRGNVVTIEPTADLTAAVKLLAERRIGAVVILGANHRACRSGRRSRLGACGSPSEMGFARPRSPSPVSSRSSCIACGLIEPSSLGRSRRLAARRA